MHFVLIRAFAIMNDLLDLVILYMLKIYINNTNSEDGIYEINQS